MSRNKKINYIAISPTDVKANVQNHNSSYPFMDKEKIKAFHPVQILRDIRQH